MRPRPSVTPPFAASQRPPRALLPALLCTLSAVAGVRGEEPPRPPTGEARLESGRLAGYTVHFDRNSLRDSLDLGDGLVALTSSGALLRFELPAVRLVRERIDSVEITCLGRGEGGAVLAGGRDGRVYRVDPATLDRTEVARLPDAPQWIAWGRAVGNRPAGLVVVTRATRPLDRDGQHWDVPYAVVHDLASQKTFTLEETATTFLLDRAGRVWLGLDKGEWGGRVTRVDLAGGTVTAVKPPPSRDPARKAFWEGVYGFIERADGVVLAFGGSSHMGFNSGAITRLDTPEPQTLFAFEPPRDREAKPDPDRPRMPITHVVEENDGLVVFSYSDVFRVDTALKSWKKFATLDINYRPGRPDAVGSYPSVSAVHPPRRPGGPWLIATVADGYVVLEGTKAASRRLPGQLGASRIDRVENTAEGALCFEWDDQFPAWKLGEKGWEIASVAPPVEPDPGNDVGDFEKDQESWYETRVLVDRRGSMFTVSGTAITPGTRTTARRVDGKSERLGRETSSLSPPATFLTADGTLWNASDATLSRFEQGRWETVARAPPLQDMNPYRLKVVHTDAPPWLLLEKAQDDLWRLLPGVGNDPPRLERVAIREGGKRLPVNDAIPWHGGALLLATDAGLRAYDPVAGKLSRTGLPEPASRATSLVRDGQGHLWLGGTRGLARLEAGGKTVESLDRVPWVGRSEVSALAPDPRHGDGVLVALDERGVAAVRVRPGP